ncbi:Uncharacterised protein [Afipia felis]|uniref:Uncharacterized protein n=2 Tax=Afipia felis TaxID=1035 RepID=A0A380W4S7_AFIFE|nr:hypothetical protein HMPREF9697_03209 [Afipia felis ATCC 53690]SUU75426.1 Uncharacterised protein [Afipia felis]SUU83493.1 Uncharacterised protein [Afipia felis]
MRPCDAGVNIGKGCIWVVQVATRCVWRRKSGTFVMPILFGDLPWPL